MEPDSKIEKPLNQKVQGLFCARHKSQKIAACGSSYGDRIAHESQGAAAGCDLLINLPFYRVPPSDMLTAFRMHRSRLCMPMLCLHHRNLIPVAVMKLTFAEVIPFPQRRQILITQDALGTGGKH